MSVNWYVACESCKKSMHVAQDGLGGFSFYSGEPECMKALPRFLEEHLLCSSGVKFLREDYDEGYQQIGWDGKPVPNIGDDDY